MDKQAFRDIIKTKGFGKQVWSHVKTFGITFTAALASVWGVAELYLETYVKEVTIDVIEESHSAKSFREVLGEKMDIPEDEVAIRIVEKFRALDSLTINIGKFEELYTPYLNFQLKITHMYRYLDETGIEYWVGPDGRSHCVLYDNGEAWCVYSNRKQVILIDRT